MPWYLMESMSEKQVGGEFLEVEQATAVMREINQARRNAGSHERVKLVKREVLESGEVETEAPCACSQCYHGRGAVPIVMCPGVVPPVMYLHPIPATGAEWRRRELNRVALSVPWNYETWWLQSPHYRLHYPFPSVTSPGVLAYTPSEEWGVANRQQKVRPGRYLQQYFGEVLSSEDVQCWAMKFAALTEQPEVHFARTPDEIEEVYVKGPRSCMSHGADDYATGGVHPTRVYGAGDLAVAYLGEARRATARCVVWPERKVRTRRIYGDGVRLGIALDALGYSSEGSFEGARVLKIERDDGYVMPYLDFEGGVTGREGSETQQGEETLLISRYGESGNEEGLTRDAFDDRPVCEECGERCDEDVGRAVEGAYWCDSCIEQCASRCRGCYELFRDDNVSTAPNKHLYCAVCYGEEVGTCEKCEDEVMVNQLAASGLCEECEEERIEEEERQEEERRTPMPLFEDEEGG